MPIRTLAAAALVAALVLIAPTAAHADPSHTTTLSGLTVTVALDAESFNAGQQASVVVMHVGARYSNPAPADLVYLNEYTLDGAGTVSFSIVLPSGDLDDYVLAVKVAGATARYVVSLDPAGPAPVEPPTGGGPGGGGDGGDPLANTGTTIAIGTLGAIALGTMIVGAVLIIRRRTSRTEV